MNPDWIVPDWPLVSGVRSFCTTRIGGNSQGPWRSMNLGLKCGDEPEQVNRNRVILRQELPADPIWLRQVHGTSVHRASSTREAGCPEADAVVARHLLQVCAILTADCLPVVFCNRQGTEVAAAHAGWRGLCAGVLEETVRTMFSPAVDLQAWLGPAIGPQAYEVGEDVRTAFLQHDASAETAFRKQGELWLLDLYAVARQRLEQVGVRNISGGNFCTFSDPERFFSYRRDGVTGRMATLIWLDEFT